jgi:hypothetical protein
MPLTEVGLWGPEVDSRELGPSFGRAETRSRAQPFFGATLRSTTLLAFLILAHAVCQIEARAIQ